MSTGKSGEVNFVYGIHTVQSLLKHHPSRIKQLIIQQGARREKLQSVISQAEHEQLPLSYKSRVELDKLAGDRHQGVVAICYPRSTFTESQLEQLLGERSTPLLLVLDHITDPHNLGACIRVADGAGVDAVIVHKHKSASLSATVAKVASGALESVPVVEVNNLANHLRWLKQRGIWLIGTSDKASQGLYDADFNVPLALIMGAEGTGLRPLTQTLCDHLIRIPMSGQVNSLNVSVASGVCLFEAVRQRHFSRTP